MYTIGLGNFFDAYAKNDMSVDPAALDLRQGVEGVPEPDKQLHAFQKLLGCGLMQAGGVFDPVLTVQRILRFVPGEPPLVGRFIADAGPERLGHFRGLAESGTQGSRPAPLDKVSRSRTNKKRLRDTRPRKRMK